MSEFNIERLFFVYLLMDIPIYLGLIVTNVFNSTYFNANCVPYAIVFKVYV